MSGILDAVLAVILIISFIAGYKKGFVKSIQKIAALVITIVLVVVLKEPVINFMSGSNAATAINEKISETVHIPQGGGVNIAESLNLPEFMQPQINEQISTTDGVISSMNEAAVSSLTNIFITVIACISLFIVIRLLLTGLFMIINTAAKAPVINSVNRLLGALLMTVNMLFVIFLVLALVSLFAPADSELFDMINNTYTVKYLYNYNILLQLFMKI